MFRWLPIVWANLKRRKLRLAFTFVSILMAFLMFGMLDAMRTSLAGVVNVIGADRVLVQSKINMIMPLPRGHYEKIRATPGVKAAASFNWFGGVYKDAKQPIQMQATDPAEFLRVYPEVKLKPEEITAWERNRQGMIIGRILANNNGWKVGDRVPIRSQIWRKLDGSDTWQFDIVGIYSADGGGMNQAGAFFQYEYFNESLQFGKDQAGMIAVRVADPKQSDAIGARIDAQFENSPNETKTATERQFVKRMLEQVGNIGAILVSVTAAVFFTMLLVTANTMALSVSERTNEIGVLKTLGFSGRTIMGLVLSESLFLTIMGGLVGLGLAWFLASIVGAAIKDYFPSFHIGASTFSVGIALMLAFGLITGAWPALAAMRLKIVDALRRNT
jgi:putative ABC transport system permease protein